MPIATQGCPLLCRSRCYCIADHCSCWATGLVHHNTFDVWLLQVRVWDERTFQCLEILKGHTGPVRTLVYANGMIFSGSYDKTVRGYSSNRCFAIACFP